jgi:hypothetical protein
MSFHDMPNKCMVAEDLRGLVNAATVFETLAISLHQEVKLIRTQTKRRKGGFSRLFEALSVCVIETVRESRDNSLGPCGGLDGVGSGKRRDVCWWLFWFGVFQMARLGFFSSLMRPDACARLGREVP